MVCSGIGLMSTLEGCASIKYVNYSSTSGMLLVDITEIGEEDFVVLSGDEMEHPIFLFRDEQGSFSAVSMECTHKGCDVSPKGSKLVCPCHGGEFKHSGELLKGPAEEDLATYEVSEEEDQVRVHLK